MSFYVDTCIYLNLWQGEEREEVKFWRIAEEFFKRCDAEKSTIIYSGFVRKELQRIAPDAFARNKLIFTDSRFNKITASSEDYSAARVLESASNFSIGFFDCMHIVLTIKAGAILVTRDRALIEFAVQRCRVARPEELK